MGDMNAPLRTRIREGCRGGREQFSWNSIKDQEFKDREQYLGATTKVGMMGKFGRYQLHDWYARKRDTPETIDRERDSVQAYEEELMQEALGLKPKKLMLSKRQLTQDELQEVLKRDSDKNSDKKGRTQMGPQGKLVTNEYGEQVTTSNEEQVAVAAREAPIKGLGFAMHRNAKLEAIKAETLGTEGQLEGSGPASSSSSGVKKEEVKEEVVKDEADDDGEAAGATLGVVDARVRDEPSAAAKRELPEGGEPSVKRRRGSDDAAEDERRGKKDKKDKEAKKRKKAEKKLKKIEKKLKKAAKKEKKASKRAKQEKASSSSSSSST